MLNRSKFAIMQIYPAVPAPAFISTPFKVLTLKIVLTKAKHTSLPADNLLNIAPLHFNF